MSPLSGLSFRVLLQKALAREKKQATEKSIQMEWAAVLEAQADRATEEAVIKTILERTVL